MSKPQKIQIKIRFPYDDRYWHDMPHDEWLRIDGDDVVEVNQAARAVKRHLGGDVEIRWNWYGDHAGHYV